jgi:dihydroorotase
MGISPDDPPPSGDRRRLLFALGATAVNLTVLHRLDLTPRSTPAGSTDPAGPEVAPGQPGRTGRVSGAAEAGLDPGPADRSDPVEARGRELPTAEPPSLTTEPHPGPDHVYDLVVAGGRVMDPASGFDALADVGIDGDRVTGLAAGPLRGRRVLDASGRVVAPGFVDLLSYEPNPFGVWFKVADGVTTNLAQHGVSNYPAAFFDRYLGQTPVHFGGAFHHHFMRGFDLRARIDRPLTPLQLDRLVGLAGDALDRGMAGISFSPEYSPGTTTGEMERLARLAAERGHVCWFHARHSDPNPPGTGLEAVDEVIGIARRTGASVHLQHLTSTGGTFAMDQALERIETARSEGFDVTACLYPYDFWGTFLASARFGPGWRERYGLSVGDLQIAGTDRRLTEAELDAAVADNALVAAHGSIPEAAIRAALERPWTMIASDAIPTPDRNNHPRGAGTFARTIARYVRTEGVLNLMDGLAKSTILPVRRMEGMIPALATKGRVQRGADADLVVFDPVTIVDQATVADPAAPSVGVDHLLVGGRVVRSAGQTDRTVLAGTPLRAS